MDHYARVAWQRSLEDARNVIDIHGAVRQDPGRRYEETSLNAAAVVLAVAAWQAFVEFQIRRWLSRLEPQAGWYDDDEAGQRLQTADAARYQVWRAQVLQAVLNFNTPNSQNTRRLFQMVGIDPYPAWTWSTRTGDVTPTMAARRLDEWLSVRHAIAHGDVDLPEVDVLARTSSGRPTLWRKNAESCISLMDRLATATASLGPEATVDELVELATH